MAEIVGLTASVVAITAAAGTALKVAGRMVDLAKDLSTASNDIRDFADDMQVFYMAIDLSLNCLRRHSETSTVATSPVLTSLLEKNGFEMLVDKSKRTRRRINKAWTIAKSIQSKPHMFSDTRSAIKWVFRKPEILALRPHLEAFKTDILVIITSLAIELKMFSLEGDLPEPIVREKLQEIEDLKAQIKVHVKTIALAQEREERYRQREYRDSSRPEGPYERQETLEDILVGLGSSIGGNSRAPSQRGLSPSSSTTTDIFRRPSEATTDASTPPSTPQSESPQSSRHVGSPSSSYRFLGTDLTVGDPPLLRPPTGRQVGSRESVSQEQEQVRSAQVPPLRQKQERVVADSTPTPPIQIQSTSSSSEKVVPEGSIPVRCSRATGYINTPTGLVEAKAKIATNFPEHAISAEYANILGLPIQPHGEGSENGTRMLENFYSNGVEIISTGTVTLEWRGASTTPPFIVKCRVFPDQPENLVFGKNFLERRTFYADGGEDALGGEWMR
ncbi:hypothetical protein DL98DRAFT_605446 [Cadophora sp. DSE1049]|nr:hypothetical protein DL98DRAFT_605446 [Cadophora sp. DSE1049]